MDYRPWYLEWLALRNHAVSERAVRTCSTKYRRTMEDFYDDVETKTWNHNWTDDYLANIDTSQYPFPNTLWHVRPVREVLIKASLTLLVAVPGLILNFVILFIIIRNKWLWTASNYLIGNMALVDFTTLLFCPWFMLVRDFYQNYVLKTFGCRFEGFMQASLLIAGIGSVMLVCYDRLAAAALSAEARVTKCVAPKLIVGSWIISWGLSLPWSIRRTFVERQWLDYLEMFCAEDLSVLGIYWHFMLSVLVWIPLGIMILTYVAIMWRLEWSVRQLSNGCGRSIARARSRAVRVAAAVLLAGAACRVPYTALIYWRNHMQLEINAVEGSFGTFWFAANLLMYANCALNPLIYGFTNTRFKKAMDRTVPFTCCRFGNWCCVCTRCKKNQLIAEDKNTEKIFVIENTPRPNKKLKEVIKNILHINKDSVDLSNNNKNDEVTAKPTKCTPLKTEYQV